MTEQEEEYRILGVRMLFSNHLKLTFYIGRFAIGTWYLYALVTTASYAGEIR